MLGSTRSSIPNVNEVPNDFLDMMNGLGPKSDGAYEITGEP